MAKKEFNIEERPIAHDVRVYTYDIPKHGKVGVSPFFQDFLEQLRELPLPLIVYLLNLSASNLEKYLKACRKALGEELKTAISKKYLYRETGEEVDLEDVFQANYNISFEAVSAKLKRGVLSAEDLEKYLYPFRAQSEIYVNEESC
jgi:hypothetical protein